MNGSGTPSLRLKVRPCFTFRPPAPCRLTSPSSGRPPAGYASFRPPLMSDVRSHLSFSLTSPRARLLLASSSACRVWRTAVTVTRRASVACCNSIESRARGRGTCATTALWHACAARRHRLKPCVCLLACRGSKWQGIQAPPIVALERPPLVAHEPKGLQWHLTTPSSGQP